MCYLSGHRREDNKIDDYADASLHLGLRKRDLKASRLTTLRALARVIDEGSVDLLVCQFRRQIAIGLLAVRFSKRKPKVVAVLHGIVGGKVGLGRKLFNYFFYRGLSRLVSVSQSGVEDILRLNWGLDTNKVVAIPNGIDLSPYLDLAESPRTEVFGEEFRDTLVFGAIGRLTEVKNLERTLRGFAIASQQRPEIRLVLGALDVFVMPSLREGLPRALLEAMGAGLPVLTSNCSGMKEVVGNAHCGRLVDPLDIAAIACAFTELASTSRADRSSMGQTSRDRVVRKYNAARMAADYGRLYKEVLGV